MVRLILCFVVSIAALSAQGAVRRVPILASYAEKAAIVLSVSQEGTYWFSECKLPVEGVFESAGQLTTYLNLEEGMCNSLSTLRFGVSDRSRFERLQFEFNSRFSKVISDRRSSAPWNMYMSIGLASLGTVVFFRSAFRADAFMTIVWGYLTYQWIPRAGEAWIENSELQGSVPPMIENLVGAAEGSKTPMSPEVSRTLYLQYRASLIESIRAVK